MSLLAFEVEPFDKTLLTVSDMSEFSYDVGEHAKLLWRGSGITATLTLFVDGGILKSSLSVSTDGKGISRVYYPIYEGVRELPDDRILLPWQNGLEVKRPIKNLLAPDKRVAFWMGRGGGKYENEYPAQFSYQFFAYYSEDGNGYYMSCDDGNAYIKTMGIYLGKEDGCVDFRFVNYPEGMGKVSSYLMPYNYAFSFIGGGWQSAASLYRCWAREQKWYTPLDKRNISKAINEIDFVRINHEHYRLGTDDEEYLETSRLIKERLDARPLMHWYGWNKAPKHGDWYPEMADWTDGEWYRGLKNRNAKLDEIGVKKIPYVNVHLWDKKLKSFEAEEAEDSLIVPESLKISDEPWIPERSLYAVCHATDKIKNKARSLFSRLVTADGFDGIYIDQVASFNATLCFGENHGHPIGGGRWWADEYHDMIGEFRNGMPSGKILTTESCCECYHDLFDMFLILDTTAQASGFSRVCGPENTDTLPLFATIYGDSAVAYGSSCKLEEADESFEYNYIRNIIFGMIPTVEGMELAYKDEDKKWEIMKRGVDFFKTNREVLIYGHLREYLTFGKDRVVVFKNLEKHCPDVICAVYEYGENEHRFAYNYADTERTVTVNGKSISVGAHSFIEI